MTNRDVELIARNVIVTRGLPFNLLTIDRCSSGWDIRLRYEPGDDVVALAVHDGRPVAVRTSIQEQLEAYL